MSPSPLNNDIALIELDGYIKFDNHAKPVCLPEAGVDIPVGTGCMISGVYSLCDEYQMQSMPSIIVDKFSQSTLKL